MKQPIVLGSELKLKPSGKLCNHLYVLFPNLLICQSCVPLFRLLLCSYEARYFWMCIHMQTVM